jgi:hypothetical protein
MSDTASTLLLALGTLLYLTSALLGFDVLRKIARISSLGRGGLRGDAGGVAWQRFVSAVV